MLLVAIFVLGYLAVVFEHPLRLNKSASALLTGVLCWTVHAVTAPDRNVVAETLNHHLSEISGILFFLLGAMTIVELIDAHDGFELITARVTARSRRKLLALVALLSFVLSSVLDNLTTSIVMISIVRRLMTDEHDRMYFGGVVIIAANAGGAWSPIGDVTTTMLWVGGQITSSRVVTRVLVPALVSVFVPLLVIGVRMKGDVDRDRTAAERVSREWLAEIQQRLAAVRDRMMVTLPAAAGAVGKGLAELDLRARTGASVLTVTRDGGTIANPSPHAPLHAGDMLELSGDFDAISRAATLLFTNEAPKPTTTLERAVVLAVGLLALLVVPLFKTITHLPPVIGVLLGLGVLWVVTEIIHKRKNDEERSALSVAGAMRRIDAPSILFFLGILLAIGALQSSGLLATLAGTLDRTIGNTDLITISIGLLSSVVDNVPLVAAAQRMYPLALMPADRPFWSFLAYCAGTGGSILIIGSAAGIAVMGIQRISFGWYVRRLSLPALLGYAAGALAFLGMQSIR